jgi:hypothetical protein
LNDYQPVAVILHPSDWRAIELQKTESSVDAYTLGHADGARYVQAAWGRHSGACRWLSRAMLAGTFLLGDFAASTMLFDRQQPTIEVGYVTGSDFTNNLLVIRAEMRAALGVAVPSALVSWQPHSVNELRRVFTPVSRVVPSGAQASGRAQGATLVAVCRSGARASGKALKNLRRGPVVASNGTILLTGVCGSRR